MYIDGKKALLMIKDPDVKERMKNYLFHRRNLLTESSDDILEVLSRIGSTDSYELVILDESVEEVYPIVCKLLVETFQADGSLLVNLRLGEEPVTRAIAAGTHPPDNREKQEFHIKSTGHLRDLITYYRPVHVPDLDEAPEFRRELEGVYRHVYAGNAPGFQSYGYRPQSAVGGHDGCGTHRHLFQKTSKTQTGTYK
jgi:hypothetical protein